jgi:phosphoglycerate dehydrogenase-like enzyme
VTFSPSPPMLDAIAQPLDGVAELAFLNGTSEQDRTSALESADAVLAWGIASELDQPGDLTALEHAGLLQLVSAGVDRVPFDRIPVTVPVASNAGAYAEPMAEHVLAMSLALAKLLPQNHAAMRSGEFPQHTPTRAIRGALVGVLGFGGIGQASARLFTALGARIHAINRSGRTDEPVESVGTLAELDTVLETADIVVIALPLARTTSGLIGRRELELMKPDGILVNVARAGIVDEDALYEHLERNPSFAAGIDTWWQEPRGSGSFATRRPLLELPNVIGSPHNSTMTPGSIAAGARLAAENVARYLRGEPPRHLVDRADYVD